MELNYISPQRKLTPDINISEWNNLATAGVSSEPFSNLQLAKLKGSLQVFGGFSINRWFKWWEHLLPSTENIPKSDTKKTKKSSNKNGGVSGFHHFFLQVTARWWTSCWLQEPRPACVLPMLRSKGRHRNKPPSWRRPPGRAPKRPL